VNPVLSYLTDPTSWTEDRQFAHITERGDATPTSQAPASSAGIDIDPLSGTAISCCVSADEIDEFVGAGLR
jgi:hypothetical protein